MTNQIPIFNQLYNLVQKHVTNYRTDLEEDKEWIENNPKIPFIHASRNTGTHLIALTSSDDYPPKGQKVRFLFGFVDRNHLLDSKMVLARHVVESTKTLSLYYFNGEKLKRIDKDKVLTIVSDYKLKIERQWKKEN